MAIRTEMRLESKIFDKSERRRVLGRVPRESAKREKVNARQRMIRGPHTGALYRPGFKGNSPQFRRFHRASARGERPSPDTMTLVNAVSDRSTGEMQAEVYIAEKVNPANGVPASEYAEYLQNNMARPILDAQDARNAEKDAKQRSEKAVQELL